MRGRSKREHCPSCKGTKMQNFVHVKAGEDMEVFSECAECQAFVARYTLKMYTSDEVYKSYLRMMHDRRMDSGISTKKMLEEFKEKLYADYRTVKEAVASREEKMDIDELIEEE